MFYIKRKTLGLTAAMIVSAASLTGLSSTAASAHPYRDYDHCVSVTWDHIGCALIIAFGIANVETPGDLTPREADVKRAKMLEKAGAFERVMKTAGKVELPGKGVYKRTCKMGTVHDLVEKGANLQTIAGKCYRAGK